VRSDALVPAFTACNVWLSATVSASGEAGGLSRESPPIPPPRPLGGPATTAPPGQPTGTAAGSSAVSGSLSMRTAQTLNSAVLVTGSEAELVSSLTGDSL